MSAPRKGSRGTYDTGEYKDQFTVIGTEGPICWVRYDKSPDIGSCFIWRFKDGLNKFHDWPGKTD